MKREFGDVIHRVARYLRCPSAGFAKVEEVGRLHSMLQDREAAKFGYFNPAVGDGTGGE